MRTTVSLFAPLVVSSLLGFARRNFLVPNKIAVRTSGPVLDIFADFASPFGSTTVMFTMVEILPGVLAVSVTILDTLEADDGTVLDHTVSTATTILGL